MQQEANMEQLKLVEKRRSKRFSIRLKVYSQQTNIVIGYAENLSMAGMLLMSLEPVPEKQELQIWFGADKENNPDKKIALTAYRVWSSFTESVPRLFCSGLHFVNPTNSTLDKIQNLLDNLSE